MAEKETSRKVYVEVGTNVVIGHFGQKDQQKASGNSEYYVSVELGESELRLKGEPFINAVRQALTRAFGQERKIAIYKGGPVTPSPTSQILGFMVDPETIKITDRWSIPRST